jgi:hypothetical protein
MSSERNLIPQPSASVSANLPPEPRHISVPQRLVPELQHTRRDAAKMSSIVDATSSLTSLPATSPSQPPGQQQSQASRSPAASFSPTLSPRPRPRRGDEAAGASGSATTQGGKRKREKPRGFGHTARKLMSMGLTTGGVRSA